MYNFLMLFNVFYLLRAGVQEHLAAPALDLFGVAPCGFGSISDFPAPF